MRKMKLASTLFATTLFAALFLTACGEKPAEEPAATSEAMPAETAAPAAATEEAAPAANEPGGYVPTEEERVPGITVPAEGAATEDGS
jgi:hypothetical protein